VADPVVAALILAKAAVASERGVQLGIADDAHLTAEAGDARDLVTVVGNLIDNAIDAAAPSRGSVEVSLRSGPDGVEVRVRDSGPGVDPAIADEIFHEGATSKPGHFGMGLALVQEVARRHGGWVRVTNDGGAVFTASLPREAEVRA
jgi:two-component system CitB family sensor kinase